MNKKFLVFLGLIFLLSPILISAADDDCSDSCGLDDRNRTQALKFKLIVVASILVAGALGVSLPFIDKVVPALRPESNMFFCIKDSLHWVHPRVVGRFRDSLQPLPVGEAVAETLGLVAMLPVVGTMMVDLVAMSCYRKAHFDHKHKPIDDDEAN